MGISSALYAGISGLNTNGNAMSVIGNNIANTNTVGFKGSTTVFSDILSSSVSGSGGSSQIGRGSQLSSVNKVFSQGTFESTTTTTDLAIEGESFFVVGVPGTAEVRYTRAGAFRFDNQGYMVNAEGLRVQGKGFNTDGTLSVPAPGDIRVDNTVQIAANPTANMTLTTNLDANSSVIAGGFLVADPVATSNYAASLDVFDTLGNTHLLTTYFTKTGTNQWDWNTVASSSELATPGLEDVKVVGNGTLEFDDSGALIRVDGLDLYQTPGDTESDPVDPLPTGATAANALDWTNGSDAALGIKFNFQTTQNTNASVVIGQDQDGYGAGELVKVSIDNEGTIIGNYSNGESISVGRVALAKFSNPGGLESVGGSMYAATGNSGTARVGTAGSSMGKIFTNSLEQSNVDLAQEFVKMITTQRGFQANSRVITTTDEMLGELINLKR